MNERRLEVIIMLLLVFRYCVCFLLLHAGQSRSGPSLTLYRSLAEDPLSAPQTGHESEIGER